MTKKPVEFNPYQLAVVNFRRGYAAVMAAPGSGKTEVVIARIKKILAAGIQPENVLSLTFTKEGAKEMAERAGLKDVEYQRGHNKHLLFTTFHSWALRFIRAEGNNLPFEVHKDFSGNANPLCLPLEAARTMVSICRGIAGIDWKEAASFTSNMKRHGIAPDEAMKNAQDDREESCALAYAKYDAALRSKGLLDFDSIVIETANLLEQNAEVRARWQYRHVQVDEAQDTDAVQWRVIKQITEENGNALVVGDENQGMYSWRGSESNLTEYFCNLFPSAVVLPLPENFRSTQAIVDYCKEIAPNQNETITKLYTRNEKGEPNEFNLYTREDEEAKAVINRCVDVGNTAILARTNRQLAAFEDECGQRNMKYKLLGKSGFWGQPEVKDVVGILGAVVKPTDANILKMLSAKCDATKFLRKTTSHTHTSTIDGLKDYQKANPDRTTGDPVPLNRLLGRYYSGDTAQDNVVREIAGLLERLRRECAAIPGGNAMQKVVDYFGIMSCYDVAESDDEDKKNFDNDPRENIMKLMDYAKRHTSLTSFHEYTERVRRSKLARTNCLILATIHAAKGKQWEHVFVTGVNEGMLPHAKGDELEEKRIYFVACSRPAKRLYVSASGVPSAFIKEKLPKAEDGNFKIDLDPWLGFQLVSR